METQQQNQPGKKTGQQNSSASSPLKDDAVEADATPVLDEEDLEENDLSEEDAENIEWEGEDDLVAKASAQEEDNEDDLDDDFDDEDFDEEDDDEEESNM